jgi:adenylyl-sulfate kinase
MSRILHKELSYKITGLLFKTHKELGRFKNEKQYADYFEELLSKERISYKREHKIDNRCICDFIIDGKVILEFKAKNFINKEDYYQTKRYLDTLNLELGIIVNFRQYRLSPKRVLNSNLKNLEHSDINSGYSDYKPFVLWLTGLSASGKTTLAKALKEELIKKYDKVHHLDGDEVRAASKERLGFSKEDRDKNIKLAIDLAKKYQENGYVVIASFISPYREHRDWGRDRLDNYLEVFVNSPLEVCEARDPKGMYKKARTGKIPVFTGVSDPYEEPGDPHLHLKTDKKSVEECTREVIKYLEDSNLL